MYKSLFFKKITMGLVLFTMVTGIFASCSSSPKVVPTNNIPPEEKYDTPTPQPQTDPVTPTPESVTPAQTPEATVMPTKKDVKVKGLYVTGWTIGDDKKLQYYVDLANQTEINTYVIDIKNDDGIVSYESSVPQVIEAGNWTNKYNPEKVIKTFHDNNIYVIGRVVCFRDPAYSKKHPELAVKHVNGGLWREEKKDADYTWLNPYNKSNWPYLVAIAKEAVEKGFDEIQFDYIRFPYGDRSKMDFGSSEFVKHEVINEFLAYARQEMPDMVLSADVFGIICESPGDREDIGQYLELIGKDLDYISPMAYPSLYALGQIVNKVKFPKPDLEPYAVVYNTLLRAKERISQVKGYKADVRPFIQAYTASWLKSGYYQEYGAEQYRQQIQAVYDAGYEQWIFWDANNKYKGVSAFEKEK